MNMSDMKLHLQEGEQRLAQDLRTLVADSEALLRIAVRDAGEGYAEARVRLERTLASARAQLAETEGKLVTRAQEAGRATQGYVQENPWTAIGIGAGVGVLLGVLLGRR